MPTFLIRGADRRTGADMTLNVEASSEREAGVIASKSDVLVASMERLPDPVGRLPVARVVEEPPPRRNEYREYQPRLQQGHVRGAPVMNVALPRRENSSAVASLILGLVAFLICWIPLLGLLGVPLSGLGLLLAGVGFLVALTRGGAGIGYALGGGVVSGLSLFVTLTMTTALVGGVDALEAARQQAQEAVARGDAGAEISDPEVVWTPMGEVLSVAGVDVKVVSARVGTVKFSDGTTSPADEPLLAVEMEITNTTTHRKVEYYTWRDDLEISDNLGNRYDEPYMPLATRPEGAVFVESIYPGARVGDVLVFERPIDAAETLYLELDARKFGGRGALRFAIPLQKRDEPAASPSGETWSIARLPVRLGDVELRFTSARVGPVEVRHALGSTDASDRDLLQLKIEVKNLGRQNLEYSTWGKPTSAFEGRAVLVDGFGNEYPMRGPADPLERVVGTTSSSPLYPGLSLEDVLVFDPPIETAEYLNLRLPGDCVGQDGEFRVMIPTRMIER